MFKRIAAISLAVALATFFISYLSTISENKKRAIEDGNRVNLVLKESFDYAEKLSLFTAKKIVKDSGYKDLNRVHKIFLEIAQTQNTSESVISWGFLDWVNRNDKQIVNTVSGVNTKNPPDLALAGREYNWRSIQEAWKLKFSKPAIGIPSAIPIIPTGLWTEKDGVFVGAVALGISIQKLTTKITSQIGNESRFMIVNADNYRFIFSSRDFSSESNSQEIKNYEKWSEIGSKKLAFSPGGILSNPIRVGRSIYIHAKAMEEYPFIILTGYDYKYFWREIFLDSLVVLAQMIGLAVILKMAIKRIRRNAKQV